MIKEASSKKNHESLYSKNAKVESIISITTPIIIHKFSFKNKPIIFIKELNNSDFIFGFHHYLIILDNQFHQKKEFNMYNNMIYNICVREQNEGIIICSENETNLITCNNFGEYKFNNNKKIKKTSFACAEISNNNHIICYDIGVFHYIDFFDITNEGINSIEISDKSYGGVISINKNISAIISNKNLSNGKGEDKLIFYHRILGSEIEEIKGYSFNCYDFSSNGLAVITNIKNKYKILLCSCKSSEKNEMNGILYIYINDDNPQFNKQFIDTENFEVYSFCQLFKRTNKILDDNDNEENGTDFILVGGYDHNKKEGIIKVYIVEDDLQKIENINIIINNEIFKESKAPINNIIQSKNTREIIIGTQDGFIYILETPDIKDLPG